MATASLISIIIPLYNEGNNVVELIEHLTSVSGFHEKILVDASTQTDSKSILAESMQGVDKQLDFRCVSSQAIGRAVQMNLGATCATGDILVFLHCDTRLPGDAMNLIQQSIRSGNDWGRFDVSLDSGGLIYRVIERMISFRSRVSRIATGDQALFVTSDLFKKCGGYPQIALMEDIAISKLLNRYSKPGLINQHVVTSARRWQNTGVFKTILLMWKLRFLYWIGVDSARLADMYGNDR